jgi:phage/plasmid-like protein (TIGR03299 family)
MPAAVETLGSLAAFASREEPAWHALGTVFGKNEAVDKNKIMELAHLNDWNVRLVALSDVTAFGSYAQNAFLVVRDNPFIPGQQDVLAVVGDRYNPIQNETFFGFADNLTDGGGVWETAGSIKDGRVVFGSLSFDDTQIVLDPAGRADVVNTYLLVSSSHDGSAPMSVLVTPTRVVCQNTLNIAIRGARNVYKVRHTLNAQSNVDEARAALGVSFRYFEAFQAEAEKMIQTEINRDTFFQIVEALYPKPEDDKKGAEKKWANKIDLCEAIYTGSAGKIDTMSTITGTAWGAFNALTERVDYYRTIRGGNTAAATASAAGFDDNATRERQKIWDTVRAVALPA